MSIKIEGTHGVKINVQDVETGKPVVDKVCLFDLAKIMHDGIEGSTLIPFENAGHGFYYLGFIGPKAEAEEIKQQIGKFLQEELKLELSNTKTLITHARTEAARFLGYEITTHQEDTKQSTKSTPQGTKRKVRSINGGIGLRIPRDVLEENANGICGKGKPRKDQS